MQYEQVIIQPEVARRGQQVEIDYKGLLANSGADNVWLHYGFDNWRSPRTIPMDHKPYGGFTCTIRAEGNREMNFCFKDSADNWDNNSGKNWSCKIM